MRQILLVVLVACACPSKQAAGPGAGSGSSAARPVTGACAEARGKVEQLYRAEAQAKEPKGVVQDTRTALEKRRDAACEVVAKRSTACAVEDAKADLAAGKVTQQQFDKDTAKAVVAKNADKYADTCKAHKDYSSRQVRVL